jgi:hypothetical protein
VSGLLTTLSLRYATNVRLFTKIIAVTWGLSLSAYTIDSVMPAVAAVESGHDYRAVGDGGRAVGAWQVWSVAWDTANDWRVKHRMTPISRHRWREPAAQQSIGFALLSWHHERLVANGVPKPTVQQLYLSFSMGHAAFKGIGFNPRLAPARKRDAAERVRNLCP